MERRWVVWLVVVWLGAMGGGVWGREGDGEPSREEIEAAVAAMVSLVVEAPPGLDGEAVRKEFLAPYHWATFQLFGDWQ